MEDFLGNPIAVGDTVTTMVKGYRELRLAVIKSITEKTILVEYPHAFMKDRMQTYRITSNMCILVKEKESLADAILNEEGPNPVRDELLKRPKRWHTV